MLTTWREEGKTFRFCVPPSGFVSNVRVMSFSECVCHIDDCSWGIYDPKFFGGYSAKGSRRIQYIFYVARVHTREVSTFGIAFRLILPHKSR